MPVRSAIIMALLCLSCLTAVPALAENGYNPGFRTLGFWQQESGIRVDVNVWYPSVRAPRSLSYAPWTIRGARNGKPVPGRFPLILLSHPSSGTRFSFHDTAAALAARGFVVAAPTHPRDCMANMDHLFLWEQLKNRALELSATMDLLLADKERLAYLGEIVDWYGKLLDDAKGIIRGTLTTAVELTDNKRAELKAELEKKAGASIELAFDVDASILGGVVLKVGDRVLDASLRAQLAILRETFKRGE